MYQQKKKKNNYKVSGVIENIEVDGPFPGNRFPPQPDFNIYKIKLKEDNNTYSYLMSVNEEFKFNINDNIFFLAKYQKINSLTPIKSSSLGKQLTQEEINSITKEENKEDNIQQKRKSPTPYRRNFR